MKFAEMIEFTTERMTTSMPGWMSGWPRMLIGHRIVQY